jgi:multiple sugar transport system substrate-binding protein
LLRLANIDPEIAFRDLDSFAETALALKRFGIAIPIALPDRHNRTLVLQSLASWLWQNNTDFIVNHGGRLVFNLEQTIEATAAFFNILRSSTSEGLQVLDNQGSYPAFHKGHAAIGIGGLWLYRNSPGFSLPEVINEMTLTRLPAATFTGGSNLIIWKNSLHERAALELVRYLSSDEVVQEIALNANYIPSRWTQAAKSSPFQTEAYRQFALAAANGRSFPNIPSWGGLEVQLGAALYDIWGNFLANPQTDILPLVSQHLTQVNNQLNSILARLK